MTEPTDEAIRAAVRESKRIGAALRKHRKEMAAKPPADPTASERDAVTAEAVRLLREHPAVLKAWKQTAGQMRGASGKRYQVADAGLPDICFVLRKGARFGALEVKKPGRASLSQAQLDTLHNLLIAGACTGIITSAEQAVRIVEAQESVQSP